MKTDLSKILYEKYFRLNDKNIRITLKNKTVYEGLIVGFFWKDEARTKIEKWHILAKENIWQLGLDGFDFPVGNIILQKDIASIYFFQDKATIVFNIVQ